MEKAINYVLDRIYCNGESSGNPQYGVQEGFEKLEILLSDPNYSLQNDKSKNGNNILHLIAEHGLYEFYERIKNHKDYDKLKNVPNDFNMTPFDIASVQVRAFRKTVAYRYQNPFTLIPIMVTEKYYSESVPKLLKQMKQDNLQLTRTEFENAKLFFKHACGNNSENYKIMADIVDEKFGSNKVSYIQYGVLLSIAFTVAVTFFYSKE